MGIHCSVFGILQRYILLDLYIMKFVNKIVDDLRNLFYIVSNTLIINQVDTNVSKCTVTTT